MQKLLKLSLVLLMAALIPVMNGCGNKADHSSADAVRQTFLKAVEDKDWQTAYECWTPYRQSKEFGGSPDGVKKWFEEPGALEQLRKDVRERSKPQAKQQSNGEWLLDD